MRYTPAFMQRFHHKNLDAPKCRSILAKLARLAFDRSDGQVEQLYVSSITDDFLTYIIGRTTRLRCFALVSSPNISPKVLAGFVCQCPLLEELHIYGCRFSAKACRFVGRVRPELKCLRVDQWCNSDHDPEYCYDSKDEYHSLYGTYDGHRENDFVSHPEDDNDIYDCDTMPREIADTMLEMRHLQLVGISMSNKTLHAVLDNCLQLDYLDIRCCFSVFVDHLLQAKLAKIKTVRVSRYSLRETPVNSFNNAPPFATLSDWWSAFFNRGM